MKDSCVLTLLINDLVERIDIRTNTGTDDVCGDTLSGVELATAAQLDDCFTHGFPSLGDRLDLEIIQIIVMADDLFNGMEGRVDGTVAQADAFQDLAVLGQLDAGGGVDHIAGIDDCG